MTVAFEGIDWATAEQNWDLAMSTGDLPDIGDMFYLPSRIVQGQGKWGPVDLTSPSTPETFGDWNRIVEASRDESTFDGKVYGIPWRIDIRAWNGRTDLFAKVPATMEELEAMGSRCSRSPASRARRALRAAGGRAPSGRPGVRHHLPVARLHGLQPAGSQVDRRGPVDARPAPRRSSAPIDVDQKFDQNGSFFSGTVGALWGGGTIITGAQGVAPHVAPLILSGLQPAGPSGVSITRQLRPVVRLRELPRHRRVRAFLSWLSTDADMSFTLNQATSTISADADVQKLAMTRTWRRSSSRPRRWRPPTCRSWRGTRCASRRTARSRSWPTASRVRRRPRDHLRRRPQGDHRHPRQVRLSERRELGRGRVEPGPIRGSGARSSGTDGRSCWSRRCSSCCCSCTPRCCRLSG